MKHRALVTLFILAAGIVAGSVQAADNRTRVNTPVDEESFRTLDMDGDGFISRKEVRRGTNLERQFDQLDTNRDGKLSREELRGMFAAEREGDSINRRFAPDPAARK